MGGKIGGQCSYLWGELHLEIPHGILELLLRDRATVVPVHDVESFRQLGDSNASALSQSAAKNLQKFTNVSSHVTLPAAFLPTSRSVADFVPTQGDGDSENSSKFNQRRRSISESNHKKGRPYFFGVSRQALSTIRTK